VKELKQIKRRREVSNRARKGGKRDIWAFGAQEKSQRW